MPSDRETRLKRKREQVYSQQAKVKLEVLTHYGPQHALRCASPGCDVTDIDMLHLDHINNDGYADRSKRGGKGGIMLMQTLRMEGYPTGYQTMCANHNQKKSSVFARSNRGAVARMFGRASPNYGASKKVLDTPEES